MKKTLRPYQLDALTKLRSRLKETDAPLLVNASVAAGKSLIIAELLLIIERAGWRALCLTMNSTLIGQNAETYRHQGGNAGIFCAALKLKETEQPIIFASPMSVRMDIKNAGKLSKVPFNLIVIDEAHNINIAEKKTNYARIFRHYQHFAQLEGHKLRFVGLTGTPYRSKGFSIVGKDMFFKEEVCNISAPWLMENGYLVEPRWGYYDEDLQYDFKKLQMSNLGKFSAKELEQAVHEKPRLTQQIMAQVHSIVKKRKGAFIFASSIAHCAECAAHLPETQTGIITGKTTDQERERLINLAHAGKIKYLINVNVLSTGVDIPLFDTVVFVRPTESLVLYTQCLGRGLRLHPEKKDCLILDYAGNLDRHGDIDNPLINKALSQVWEGNDDYCIPCITCNAMNKVTARRCIGTHESKRCEHYFEWKNCPQCEAINDIVARQCRKCNAELIDPNASLEELAASKNKVEFIIASVTHSVRQMAGNPYWTTSYSRIGEIPLVQKYRRLQESFSIKGDKAARFFYGHFAKDIILDPALNTEKVQNYHYLKRMIEEGKVRHPTRVQCVETTKGLKIVKRFFDDGELAAFDNRNFELISIDYDINDAYILHLVLYGLMENGTTGIARMRFNLKSGSSNNKFKKLFGQKWTVPFDMETKHQFIRSICPPKYFETDYRHKVLSTSNVRHNPEDFRHRQMSNYTFRRMDVDETWFQIYKREPVRFGATRYWIGGFVKIMDEIYTYEISTPLTDMEIYKIEDRTITHFKAHPHGQHERYIDEWKTDKDEIMRKEYPS